jgi:hypothetical protein
MQSLAVYVHQFLLLFTHICSPTLCASLPTPYFSQPAATPPSPHCVHLPIPVASIPNLHPCTMSALVPFLTPTRMRSSNRTRSGPALTALFLHQVVKHAQREWRAEPSLAGCFSPLKGVKETGDGPDVVESRGNGGGAGVGFVPEPDARCGLNFNFD